MSRSRVIGAVLLGIACLAGVFLVTRTGEAPDTGAAETEHARVHGRSQAAAAPDLAPASADAPAAAPAADDPAELRRAFLARAIAQAREERLAREGEPAPERRAGRPPLPAAAPSDDAVGTLDHEYIRSRIEELKPLLAECYELALAETTDLRGRLVVEFVIAGEPDVGGIVEESHIDEESSTLAHPTLTECVRETMYTAEFTAPEGGGRVTVRYPFDFSNEE